MKEHYIDMHLDDCPSHPDYKKDHGEWLCLNSFCELNPDRFLFFLGNDFYLITYHMCLNRYDEYDFKVSLVEAIIKRYKIFDLYKVNKSVNIDKDLKNFRIKNQALRKYIKQVNYIYGGFGKEYAITTTVDYIKSIVNQEIIYENYKKAKEYLEQNKYLWLIEKLDKLMQMNYLSQPTDVEYFKTIDYLIHSINNLTK